MMLIHKQLVDGTAARLIALGIAGGKVEKDRVRPLADAEYPLCIVHVMDAKSGTPDRGPRTGMPRFVQQICVLIDYYATADAEETLKSALYTVSQAILDGLMTDAAWLGLSEGVASIDHQYHAPQGTRGFHGGMRIEVTVLGRVSFQAATPANAFTGTDINAGSMLPVKANPAQ